MAHHGNNAKRISEGETTTVNQVIKLMLDIVPDDDRFQAAVATANVSQARLARYYLRSLQLQEDGDPEPQYVPNSGGEVTLEHVIPKNPGQGWEHIEDDELRATYKKLGNQVLLGATVNSQVGNASYSDKKAALKDSPFSLTQRAASFSDWNGESVAEHQEYLAELAVKTWPLRPK